MMWMELTKFFFFNDTATTEIYTLSLHDALPIYINAGKDCYREGTFVHRREISSTSVSIRLCYKATVPRSFENFSDEPYVSERVQHSALQHPSDRTRPGRGVRVFLYWTVLGSSGAQCSHLDRNGVLHE